MSSELIWFIKPSYNHCHYFKSNPLNKYRCSLFIKLFTYIFKFKEFTAGHATLMNLNHLLKALLENPFKTSLKSLRILSNTIKIIMVNRSLHPLAIAIPVNSKSKIYVNK